MPTLNTFYLTFRAGLHIGRHGIGQEEALMHVPADTLFAALTATRAQWRGDAQQWAERFKSHPPFRLTSAFPYAGQVRFYPRPVPLPAGLQPKTWRKIRFISEAILRRLLAGNSTDPLQDSLALQGGALWLTRDEVNGLPESMRTKVGRNGKPQPLPLKAIPLQKVWFEAAVPRVMVDRISNTSEIFLTGRIAFAPGCGLWFGVEGQADDLLDTLNALGDWGLGAERSVGYGAFTARPGEPVTWPGPHNGGLMLLLSRYYPREGETALTRDDAAYNLVHVAGRVQTLGQANQRRRGVWLVAEGSLVGGDAQGELADVKPIVGDFPHAVYRYGLALGIGVGGGQ